MLDQTKSPGAVTITTLDYDKDSSFHWTRDRGRRDSCGFQPADRAVAPDYKLGRATEGSTEWNF